MGKKNKQTCSRTFFLYMQQLTEKEESQRKATKRANKQANNNKKETFRMFGLRLRPESGKYFL